MSRAPFVIIPALAAIAVDYTGVNRARRGYVADILAPRVRVDAPEFRYPKVELDDIFTVVDNQVDRLGRLNEIYSKSGEAVGATLDYGLSEPIPYRDEMAAQQQALAFAPKARAIRNIVDKNMLAREVRVAAMMQNAANYGSQYQDETATPWSGATFDVAGTVKAASDSMLLPPNTAFMSLGVYRILERSPSLSEGLGGALTKGKVLSREQIAQALEVDTLVVANTIKQTSKRGQNLTTGPIWGNNFGLLHLAQAEADGLVNDVNVPSFALTFQWGDHVSGEVADPDIGLWGGVRVRDGESLVEKVVAPLGGYLFSNIA